MPAPASPSTPTSTPVPAVHRENLEANVAVAGAPMGGRVPKDGGGFRVVLLTRAEGT